MRKILFILLLFSSATQAQFIINPYRFAVVSTVDDAQVFIDSVQSDGTVLTARQKTAITTLVAGYKSAGIWTKRKVIDPFVAGSASTHKWNLKDPRNLDAAYRLTFSGATTHSLNKVSYGPSRYANTYLAPNAMGQNSISAGVWAVGTSASQTHFDLGSYNGSSYFYLLARYSDANAYAHFNTGATGFASGGNTTDGWVFGSRTGSTAISAYKNGVSIGSNTSVASITPNSFNIYLGAYNNSGTAAGMAASTTFLNHRFVVIGDGLDATEQLNEYNLIKAFIDSSSQNIVWEGDENTKGDATQSATVDSGYASRAVVLTSNNYTQNNLSVPAHTSQTIISNMYSTYPAVVNRNTVYSIMVGAHDFGGGASSDSVYARVLRILDYVGSLGCTRKIVVTYPPDGGAAPGSGPDNNRIAYNTLVRNGATTYGYKVADADAVLPTYSTTYWFTTKNFNNAGAALIAPVVKAQIILFQ